MRWFLLTHTKNTTNGERTLVSPGLRDNFQSISRQRCTKLGQSSFSTLKSVFLSCAISVLLSHFSRVRLCVTLQTAAHQAAPSLGFSRQEHWSGLRFLLQCMKVKSESEVAQSCLTLSDPMDCSPPGTSIHVIFQARVLEWGSIALSVHLSK